MTQNLAHKKGVKQDRTKIRDAALRIIREILERPDYWNRQRASRGLAAPPPLSIFRRPEPLGWGSQMTTTGGLHRKIARRMSFGPSMSV
jgi:hypothetical protein